MRVPRHHRVRYRAEEPIESDAARLRSACELADAARELKRAQLRLELPGASEATIEARLAEWLAVRPGAEQGDGVGRPVAWRG